MVVSWGYSVLWRRILMKRHMAFVATFFVFLYVPLCTNASEWFTGKQIPVLWHKNGEEEINGVERTSVHTGFVAANPDVRCPATAKNYPAKGRPGVCKSRDN